MIRTSMVKYRKCTRRTLLIRKKIVNAPEKTPGDLQTAERSTTILTDIGTDRIES
jgi:hypothetical protein